VGLLVLCGKATRWRSLPVLSRRTGCRSNATAGLASVAGRAHRSVATGAGLRRRPGSYVGVRTLRVLSKVPSLRVPSLGVAQNEVWKSSLLRARARKGTYVPFRAVPRDLETLYLALLRMAHRTLGC
jgi:hypothetical protein